MDGAEHRPHSGQLKAELDREKEIRRYGATMRNTVYILIVVAAIAVLLAFRLVSVLRVEGNSMAPGLEEDDLVIAIHTKRFAPGDVVAFYYNNKILLKRVVGSSGDEINMDDDGNVYVNGILLEEDYLGEKHRGDILDIVFPYQVPEKRFFVLGDNRRESIDSRSSQIGAVTSDQIVGKVVLRIWPFKVFGRIR